MWVKKVEKSDVATFDWPRDKRGNRRSQSKCNAKNINLCGDRERQEANFLRDGTANPRLSCERH